MIKQEQGQQKIQFNIDKTTLPKFTCSDCGETKFIHTVEIMFIGKIQSPTGQEMIINEPQGLICVNCFKHYYGEEVLRFFQVVEK